MSACLMIAGKATTMASTIFTLGWTHSVEKTGWEEQWRIAGETLQLEEARVRGSGAGMDPGEGAELVDGWWVWKPDALPMEELLLAASGATVSGWRLCSGGTCKEIGATAGEPIHVAACKPPVSIRFHF